MLLSILPHQDLIRAREDLLQKQKAEYEEKWALSHPRRVQKHLEGTRVEDVPFSWL